MCDLTGAVVLYRVHLHGGCRFDWSVAPQPPSFLVGILKLQERQATPKGKCVTKIPDATSYVVLPFLYCGCNKFIEKEDRTMPKTKRGRALCSLPSRGLGTCPICAATRIKLLYIRTKANGQQIKVCKRCQRTDQAKVEVVHI